MMPVLLNPTFLWLIDLPVLTGEDLPIIVIVGGWIFREALPYIKTWKKEKQEEAREERKSEREDKTTFNDVLASQLDQIRGSAKEIVDFVKLLSACEAEKSKLGGRIYMLEAEKELWTTEKQQLISTTEYAVKGKHEAELKVTELRALLQKQDGYTDGIL